MATNKELQFADLGLGDYRAVWQHQQQLFEGIVRLKEANRTAPQPQPTPNYLLFVEHPHVYTLGKSGSAGNLLLTEEQLRAIDAQWVQIDRGGDITYHGPGQLVGYPIIDLDNFGLEIRTYIAALEEAIIRLLAQYGLRGQRAEGATGVWLDVDTPRMRKLCAIGVRTSRWVTMHGFALNVRTDLRYFQYINPCGFTDKGVSSLEAELGYAPDMAQVKKQLIEHLTHVLQAQVV